VPRDRRDHDTGADLAAPDLAAKAPVTYSVRTRSTAVSDSNGHGTFVASLAAGSSSNGDGIAGSSGDARLMVIEAADRHGSFTDIDEAAAIVYAVDHGARIINLSLGGAVSAGSAESRYPRVSLPGSATGLYGYASGTSFAAPQVAGTAALVWAANVAGPRRRRELPRRGRPERRRRASSHPGRHPHERLLRPCEGPHLPLHGRRTGRGRLTARGVAAPDGVVAAGSSLALRLRRARCGRRGSAGVRRCARSRGRSRRRSRSSRCPRRRAQRSASPCPRGCPDSSGARRRGVQAR
jgi:subtilisin family serine protease